MNQYINFGENVSVAPFEPSNSERDFFGVLLTRCRSQGNKHHVVNYPYLDDLVLQKKLKNGDLVLQNKKKMSKHPILFCIYGAPATSYHSSQLFPLLDHFDSMDANKKMKTPGLTSPSLMYRVDILSDVLSFGHESYLFTAPVSKAWKEAHSDKKKTRISKIDSPTRLYEALLMDAKMVRRSFVVGHHPKSYKSYMYMLMMGSMWQTLDLSTDVLDKFHVDFPLLEPIISGADAEYTRLDVLIHAGNIWCTNKKICFEVVRKMTYCVGPTEFVSRASPYKWCISNTDVSTFYRKRYPGRLHTPTEMNIFLLISMGAIIFSDRDTFMCAVKAGHVEVAKHCSPKPSFFTRAALQEALYLGDMGMVRLICEGYDRKKKTKVYKACLERCKSNNLETLKYFLSTGIPVPKMPMEFYYF